ncbi:SDR family NAD(P)-dependent oxidoreductase [Actinocrinis puniceicyclus]|uniref:SDR family NAD(P)-dependent oxidoreductase n=1 Tax=Actinocrinis puniceicyclus TaxID=977794 RepID=A0A8J8BBP6_9ACTN|nr:SDR family NAD(P)-dependent oxidoreductase [Actinocrinis puniceicyclus]MBS2964282.1 SDR family NAD(P)-dependent oxidoreductase [Actinocrinis puniceicyclus]
MTQTSSSFAGQVALVTGASGGIGGAIARRLSAHGAAVALGYSHGRQAAESLAAEIEAGGGRAVAFAADLADPAAPARLVRDVEERLGSIGILVNNAGLGRTLQFDAISVEDFDTTLAVNLRAPFLLAQRVVPAMRERGAGRILFVSSVAAFTGGIVGAHYAASKAGLHGLTHYLATLLAAHGITVNALAPALVAETGMLPGAADELAERIPVGRLGRPGEVADLAVAILRNGYMTNQVVSLDGGLHPR